jgi:hypothetical protein
MIEPSFFIRDSPGSGPDPPVGNELRRGVCGARLKPRSKDSAGGIFKIRALTQHLSCAVCATFEVNRREPFLAASFSLSSHKPSSN